MAELTWDDVLKRDDLIGGDIESQQEGVICRGPIAEIKEENGIIQFSLAWRACADGGIDRWKNWNNTPIRIPRNLSAPQDVSERRVFFCVMGLAHYMIFPKNGSRLEKHKVKGLPSDSNRLLALFPGLPFERSMAERALEEAGMTYMLEKLNMLVPASTFHDMLALFRHDSTAEEFLWFYIEAITGQKDIHRRVY